MKVLLFMGSYLPGTNSAGITTSVSNMAKELGPDVEFYIVTADRDHGDKAPYKDVLLEQWTTYEEAHVFYSQRYTKDMKYLRDIINNANCDAYYINGFYNISDNFRVFWLYFTCQIAQKKLIIAPRGIFSLGEYNNKKMMRWCYRQLFRCMRLNKKAIWHATSELEKNHVQELFPEVHNNIRVIPNMSGISVTPRTSYPIKEAGMIKIMFISRMSEKKNIKEILNALSHARGDIQMDFYGMIGGDDDKRYWTECIKVIKSLPSNIKCSYHGPVPHDRVSSIYQEHHLFFFPTFGENYGHVIAESLAFGCPLLLSDTTPWNMLEEYGAGWNYGVHDTIDYSKALQKVVDMGQDEWNRMSDCAFKIAEEYINVNKMRKSYLDNLFL